MRCAENHATEHCDKATETVVKNGLIVKRCPQDKLKCALCDGKHTAAFKDCSKRQEYKDLKAKMAERASQDLSKMRKGFHGKKNYNENFPPLTQTTNPQPTSSIWSNFAAPSSSTELFSPHQLFNIFKEIVDLSTTCKNKSEQISGLLQIYEKYAPKVP